MPLLTFDQLKQALLNNSRSLEVCDGYNDVQNAATQSDIINAGLTNNLWIWAYQSGVITDSLFSEFTESTLNDAGLYSTGSFSLTNPGTEIFIFKDAEVTVTVTGSTKCKINVLGNGQLIVNASDTSYVQVRSYTSAVSEINLSNSAVCCFVGNESSDSTIVCDNNSVLHYLGYSNSVGNITGNDSSYVKVRLHEHSGLTYEQNDTSDFLINNYDASTVNSIAL